jgi:hypothetical protein
MASNPRAAQVRAALAARATRDLGEDATALDYVVQYIEAGGVLAELARDLAGELEWEVSRSLVSHVVQRLEPDAPERLAEARRSGGAALVESAVQILDEAPTDSREELTKAKARADIRTWLAGKHDPASYGERTQVGVQLNLGQLHLAALMQPVPRPGEVAQLAPGAPLLLPEGAAAEPHAIVSSAGVEGMNDGR